MLNLLSNKLFKQVAVVTIAGIIGVVVGILITQNGSGDSDKNVLGTTSSDTLLDEQNSSGNITFRTGGGIQPRGESVGQIGMPPLGQDFAIELPMTATEAVAAGWKDPVLCRVGRGRYFQKGDLDDGEQYFLMYNSEDNLIGIYQFSEFEMLPPWEKMDSLEGGGGLVIIDFPHWGLFVYFQDSTRACGTTEAGEGTGAQWGGERSQVKSTPTPVLPPTPTPAADLVLKNAVEPTGKLKALSFELTGDPIAKKIEGTLDRKGALTLVKEGVVTVTDTSRNTEVLDVSAVPFSFDSLGATLSGIATALQDPVDAKSAYINNLKRRGVSGTVLGSDLTGLIPTAVADVSVRVSLWFDERGRVLRLQLEGSVTPNDATDIVRVLDVGDF